MPSNKTVETLLESLTLEEKLGLLHQYAHAVPRLGLAPFRTGTEGLHGVCWLGEATVFPQPVGLGATWDEELLARVGTAIGVEVRAKHAADPVGVGLNVWAPVVNPLRHPLWGRNEEGLHEDAAFSGRFGSALARGLRGDHPDVWLTVPTLKHFLGYNNETRRDRTSSQLRPRLLHEDELPAFLTPVTDGTAGAVMPGYNLVDGVPAHISPLLERHLRQAPGGDDLLVVSDAMAPSNLFRTQGFDDPVRAYATALLAGVDSFTEDFEDPAPTVRRLAAALNAGLIDEKDVDRAVRRHLTARARTGEFDPANDPYRGITPDAIGAPEHRDLAREAATKAVVLLANRGRALPLTGARTARIAVLGELGQRVLTDWYSGTPISTVSLAQALTERFGDTVTADSGNDLVRFRLDQPGHPYDGRELDEFELSDWGEGVHTLRSVSTGRFLTRVDGRIEPTALRAGGWEVQESFQLVASGRGGTELVHVGSRAPVLLDRRTGAPVTAGPDDEPDDAEPGRWSVATTSSGLGRARDVAAAATATVVVIGNDPHLNGRETQDRTTLAVPARSRELVRTARAASVGPVVLVVVSSYPYALGGLEDEVDAVLWSSHGGEALGEALAAVLIGEVEPYGRLPQTWFAHDDDLPDVLEYDAITARATYAHTRAVPLYPLGHGLAYTSFDYGPPVLSGSVEADDLVVTVPVTNTGARPADELVQVYVTAPGHPVDFPRRRLAAAVRVHLGPGERADARVPVPRRAFRVWDVVRDGWWLAPGEYRVLIARSAEDVRCELTVPVDGEPAMVRNLAAGVAADSFDAHDGAQLVPFDGVGVESGSGTAITGRRPSRPFSADYRDCLLDGVQRLVVDVRSRAEGGLPPDRAWVEVLAGSAGGAWRSLGRAEVDGTSSTRAVELELSGADSAGRVVLRLRASGQIVVRGFAAAAAS